VFRILSGNQLIGTAASRSAAEEVARASAGARVVESRGRRGPAQAAVAERGQPVTSYGGNQVGYQTYAVQSGGRQIASGLSRADAEYLVRISAQATATPEARPAARATTAPDAAAGEFYGAFLSAHQAPVRERNGDRFVAAGLITPLDVRRAADVRTPMPVPSPTRGMSRDIVTIDARGAATVTHFGPDPVAVLQAGAAAPRAMSVAGLAERFCARRGLR
jgi:hypothetical protein